MKSEKEGDSEAKRARRPARVWANWGLAGSPREEKSRDFADLTVQARDVKRE